MTRKQFKAKAAAAFKRQNPSASIEWISAEFITYQTGLKEWRGKFSAVAPGYRPSVMHACGDDSYVMVR